MSNRLWRFAFVILILGTIPILTGFQTAVPKSAQVGTSKGQSIQRKLFDGTSVFRASIKVSGLAGNFPEDSPEMSYYKLRWLPGSLEIASFEEAFPVEGATIPTEPETYSLITGYQTANTPVTVEVECTKTPEPEDNVQNGAGWKYRCLAQRVELLQFIGHEAPGLYSIDITEPKPGTFKWTPKKFETVPFVCGPQVVGVYVIYDIEATQYVDGQVAETKTYSQPYRISWLFLGCPGDVVEKNNQLFRIVDPRNQPAAITGAPSEAADSKTTWYTHAEGAYRFPLPAGWKVVEKNRNGPADPEFDALHSPDEKLVLLCGRIHQSGKEPTQTLDEFIREKTTAETGATVARFALQGIPIVRVSYPNQKGGHISRLTFLFSGKRYVINAVVRDHANLSQLDARVKEIIETLEFLEDTMPSKDLLASEEQIGDASSGTAAEDNDSIGPLPDEAAAMADVKRSPTPENISALARIRAGHAMSLLELAKQKRDPDLLRLAAMYADSATELAPTEALYWFLLSQIFAVNEGNIMADQEASDAAEKALELAPDDNRMRLFAGQLMYRQEFYSAALDRFEPAVQSDAKLLQPQLLAMMTFCYMTDLQVERGEKFFASFLEQQPEADSARLTLAILLHHSGKDDAAISEVRKVADSETASPANRAYATKLPKLWSLEEKEEKP
jgi:Tfp pilus assembly protein PilF